METSKEYYDKVMSDYRSRGARCSLRKYCLDEGVDYQWLLKAQKEYSKAVQLSGTSGATVHCIAESDPALRKRRWRGDGGGLLERSEARWRSVWCFLGDFFEDVVTGGRKHLERLRLSCRQHRKIEKTIVSGQFLDPQKIPLH